LVSGFLPRIQETAAPHTAISAAGAEDDHEAVMERAGDQRREETSCR